MPQNQKKKKKTSNRSHSLILYICLSSAKYVFKENTDGMTYRTTQYKSQCCQCMLIVSMYVYVICFL